MSAVTRAIKSEAERFRNVAIDSIRELSDLKGGNTREKHRVTLHAMSCVSNLYVLLRDTLESLERQL
jgi:hypothetical protein